MPSDEKNSGDEAIDALFGYIGRYVIFFQSVEAKIDQCLLFLWGHENWTTSQHKLARMRNQEKIIALEMEVRAINSQLSESEALAWNEHFNDLIARLHREREYRNSLLHSQYIFDFLPIGQPVMQSDRRRSAGGAEFKTHDLTQELQDEALARILHLYLDAGRLQMHLIHASFKERNP